MMQRCGPPECLSLLSSRVEFRDNWSDLEFAKRWDESDHARTNPDRQRHLSLLADLLVSEDPRSLLDLGIGSAQVEHGIDERHPGFLDRCRVTGVDASDAMLSLARQRLQQRNSPNISLIQADLIKIKELNLAETFDAIICVQMLHEVAHATKKEIFRWARRRLSPGGSFIILDRFDYPGGRWLHHWNAIWDWMRSDSNGGLDEAIRFDDYHERYQKKEDHTASIEAYCDWLNEARFQTICPYQCFNRALIIAKT